MAALIDTNILAYRFDAGAPEKQAIARDLLRSGLADGSLQIPHQAIVEFISVTTRQRTHGPPLLSKPAALREAELILDQFVVLYPTEALVRTAIRGAATYQLSWYDAHLWAYAEHFGLSELLSEDFSHGRRYGTVRAVNPFLTH